MSAAVQALDPSGLVAEGLDTVVIAAPDIQGRLFGRRVPAERFARDLDGGGDGGVDVCTSTFCWDIVQSPFGLLDTVTYTGMHTGWHDLRLVPDLATLRPAGWLDGVAVCLADCVEVADGSPVRLSPRALLRAQVDAMAERGRRPVVGTELEFYLYRGTPEQNRARGFADLEPTTLQPADYSIMQADRYEGFFADVRRRLAASGIEVEAAQGEWGLGQWEMSLGHGDPVRVADDHVLYKMALRELAAAAGMTATFMPRPVSDQPGSSCHLHLSMLDDGGRAAFFDPEADRNVSAVMGGALAGIIEHTDELLYWYAPTVNAYRRLAHQDFAGWGLTWGFDNRTTSFRVLGHQPATLRIESRLPGADANPYLALAALVASAGDGIDRAAAPGPPTVGNAYEAAPQGIAAHLGDAVEAFRSSSFARRRFGDDVVDHHAAVGAAEWQECLRAVTDWERDRYLELI